MPVKAENQPHEQSLSGYVPQTEDEDLLESSEDEDDEIKALYDNLPEDLGFTLVGMNFAQCDLRTLKKLKMDLDTFMTLSEEELAELGLKESTKLQNMFSKLAPNNYPQATYKSLFWKSKVKDLRISSEEALVLLTNTFSQTQELRKFLEGLTYTMSVDTPVNYILSKNHSSRDVFVNAVLRAGILTRCVSHELSFLIGKLQEDNGKKRKKSSEKGDKREVVADPEEDVKCVSVDKETKVHTEVHLVKKLPTPRTSWNITKCAFTVSTAGACSFALWTITKYIISSQKKGS